MRQDCGKCEQFVCSKCDIATNGVEQVQQEVMCNKVETVKGFCYLGDKLSVIGGCEATVTVRTRVGWKKFKRVWKDTVRKKLLLVDERKNVKAM